MQPTLVPEPGVIPQPITSPETVSDSEILSFLELGQRDMFIGVMFDLRGKVYTYIGLPGVEIGSTVLVPGNSFDPDPHTADVVTLTPEAPPGVAIQRILAVLA
jgi:hypothetical protein